MKPITSNILFYGDNLPILRDYLPNESVDLVYLDPPFNSQRTYNVNLRDESGLESDAQIQAFKDFWRWEETAEAFDDLRETAPASVVTLMASLREIVGETPMLAYLTMMTSRLLELRRVLKPNGSLYLHCDSTASHYLKIVLDTIFGLQNFRNEIIWKRSSAHSDSKQGSHHYGRITDTLLFYSKSDALIWNPLFVAYDEKYIERDYRRVDENGRRYRLDNIQGPGGAAKGNPYYEVMGVSRFWRYSKAKMDELIKQGRIIQTRPGAVPQYKRYFDEMPGLPIQNLWDDIPVINNRSKEMMGYPTQKPLALLERIIETSSNEGDVVLDPFCGCGTAVVAAQKLNRKWIGIDITHLSVALMKYRLQDSFGLVGNKDYAIVGEPQDLASARQLATDDRYQFQFWALSLLGAKPLGGEEGSKHGKKGADKGVDGYLFFVDAPGETTYKTIVQVKSGHVQDSQIRDLVGTMENEKAPVGIFITLEEPTRNMLNTAASAGFYASSTWQKKYPKLQILTIADLLAGKTVEMPPARNPFKQAGRIKKQDGKQNELGL